MMNRKRRRCLYYTLLRKIVPVLLFVAVTAQAQTVRVGVYDNPPKIEIGTGGVPQGIFVDIIESIAREEGWRILWVNGSWEKGLDRLRRNEIDLMPDVALSESRELDFDFNQIPVLNSWLQIFSSNRDTIHFFTDLNEKTISVLEGSIQQQVIGKLTERFNISLNLMVLPEYDQTVAAVVDGEADAVIAGRFYGYRKECCPALISTPVILHPTTLHFAAAKGQNSRLLEAIDNHLAIMLNDPRSTYYRSLRHWLKEKPRTFVPLTVVWLIVSIIAALFLLLVLSMALRWQVRRRTRELNEKNRQLESTLEELNRAREEAIKRERLHALGQLASGIAHDFNNLLVPIVSLSDLLLSDPDRLGNSAGAIQKLQTIKDAAERGRGVVDRLRQFHRSARIPEEKERIVIADIVREVISLAEAHWTHREDNPIELVLRLDDHAAITGRRSEIHEMLLNLVLNSADAMPYGGRLEIAVQREDETVSIAVKDTGIGMSEEVKEKCLQPFFTTKGDKGTGMGLSMVATTLEEHQGKLDLKSAPGMGTTFTMTFPTQPPL